MASEFFFKFDSPQFVEVFLVITITKINQSFHQEQRQANKCFPSFTVLIIDPWKTGRTLLSQL